MSVKRRDSKNRILRNGESQDKKNGRYIYKYYDILHKPHFLYSWKLEPTDKLPAGKKDDLSLREKIRLLQKDLADGIDVQGGDMTVLQLVKRYLATKTGIKATTEAGYKTVLNILEKERLPICLSRRFTPPMPRHSSSNCKKMTSGATAASTASVACFAPLLPQRWRMISSARIPLILSLQRSLSTILLHGKQSPGSRCGSS